MLPLHPSPCLPPHRHRTSHKRASNPRPPSLAPSLSTTHAIAHARVLGVVNEQRQRRRFARLPCLRSCPALSATAWVAPVMRLFAFRVACCAAVWHTPMPLPKPRPRPQHTPKRRQHTQRHCVSNTWRPKPRPHRLLHRLRRQRRSGYSSNRSRRRWHWPRLKRRRLPRYTALD